MNAVEFTTELSGTEVLRVPREVAGQLPKSGMARGIVLIDEETDNAEWRTASYEQFLRADSPEDAVCDRRHWQVGRDSVKPGNPIRVQRLGSTESRPPEESFV